MPGRSKILKDNERFAVTILGRYKNIIGPGYLMKWSGSETKWTKLSLGEVGRFVGDGTAEFQDIAIPVKFETLPKHGVKIVKFTDEGVWVEPSNVMTIRCEKCGHYTEIPA